MMNADYERGMDAANRALDRTSLNASDLLVQWRDVENRHRTAGNTKAAEYAKGFCDTVQEFLDDKGR